MKLYELEAANDRIKKYADRGMKPVEICTKKSCKLQKLYLRPFV